MKLIELCAAAILVVSCSIKEDRDDCPCLLEFDFSECQAIPQDVNIACMKADEKVYEKEACPKDYSSCGLVAQVPKGDIRVAAWWGARREHVKDGILTVPSGCQGDSLYVHSRLADCSGEKSADTLMIFKQFANVHLEVAGEGADCLSFLVIGNVNGYDLFLHKPLPGEFRYLAGDGIRDFRLPRQLDSSLSFELIYNGLSNGTLPVGEWIEKSGYSWEDESLDDIVIEIDYARCEAKIIVDDWEYGTCFKVEI